MHKVCVLGLGYIGLPTASLLANRGFQVHGVDIDPVVRAIIGRGDVHIHEPDLDVLVKSAINSCNLKVSSEPEPADIFVLSVPTPFKNKYEPDTSQVEAATKAIAPHITSGNLIILESTSPVGTTEKIKNWLKEVCPEIDSNFLIYVAHCPERVLPGQILKELISNDRVIGGIDQRSIEKASEFYRQFVTGEIFGTDARTAELVKLAENAYRDVNIAFANELSLICDHLNINIWELIRLANYHPRVNILQPGPGVGGHCIAVDPWFIVDSAPEQAHLIRTAREVNNSKPGYVVKKVKEKISHLKDPKIAFLGLTFKANVSDLRGSPALEIVKAIAEQNFGCIFVVEPYIQSLPITLKRFDHVQLSNIDIAIEKANVIVSLVDHRTFRDLKMKELPGKIIIDIKGIWQ